MLKDFIIFLNEEIDKNKNNVTIDTALEYLFNDVIDNINPSFDAVDGYKLCCEHRDRYINLVLSKIDMEDDIYCGPPCFEIAAKYFEQLVDRMERGFLIDNRH